MMVSNNSSLSRPSAQGYGTVPLEIERKFLIQYPDEAWLASCAGARRVEIVQTYLQTSPGSTKRVRKWTESGRTRFFLTIKRPVTDMTREEEEEEIDSDLYELLLKEADPSRQPVQKTRWCLPWMGHILEIDLYPFWQDQAILECELQEEKESFRIPQNLHVIREVTGEVRYLNFSPALRSDR